MSKDLKIQVNLSAMDRLTSPFKSAQKATQQLAAALSENKSKLRALSKEYNQNESQIEKYRNTLNPLKNKLTENTQALSKAYAEVRRMESALKTMTQPTERFSRKLKEAKNNVVNLKSEQAKMVTKLKDARSEFQKNGISATSLGKHQRELQNQMKGTNKEIDQQRTKLEKLNEKTRRQNTYRQRVDGLRTKAEQYANIGGRAMNTYGMMKDKIAQPISAFAQAEVASTNLKVSMMDKDGKLPESFEKVNNLATQLGDKLPGTTADFQDLMTMLIRQGMSVETILGGTGEAAAYLSVQLEMPPKQAAEFAAKMQDATRTTEKDMMGLMDVIQKGFYAGVDPTNMLGAFKNLGSAMDTIKMKGLDGAKKLAPFVAMFDQAGMDGSTSGNAMRKVLQKGMKHGDIQTTLKKLRKKGILKSNIDLDFTNGKGEFGGFDKMFRELEKLKGLNTSERIKIIEGIFGNDAEVNQVLSTLIEKGKAGYEEFAAKMEKQAALRKRVDEQLNTLTNIWEATTGTFTNLLAEIGATIAPQLKQLSKELGEIAEKVKAWVKANPELTGTLMKAAAIMTGIVGVTGALASAFSFLLFPIGRTVLFLGNLGKTMFRVIPAILSFSAALLTNPLTWIVAGIIAIIAAIVLLVKNWDTVKESLSKGWAWLSEQANEIWTNITNAISEKVETLKNKVGEITDSIGNYFNEKWNGLVDTAKNFGSNMMTKLKDGVLETFKDVEKAITDSVNWIKKQLGFSDETEKKIEQTKQKVSNATANAMNNSAAGRYFQMGIGEDVKIPEAKKYTGGYAGNGGKHEAMGVYHGGEYIFSKYATSRLGVGFLNTLHSAKTARAGMLATGLMSGIATAQPIRVDSRPPLAASAAPTMVKSQPMQVTININASTGQSAEDIARAVQRELARLENRRQAQSRSKLYDRA